MRKAQIYDAGPLAWLRHFINSPSPPSRRIVLFLRIGLAIEFLPCRPLPQIVFPDLEIRRCPPPPGEVLVGANDLPVFELLELVGEDLRLGDHAGASRLLLKPVVDAFIGDGDIDDADAIGHPLGGRVVVEAEDHLTVAGTEDEVGALIGLAAVFLHLLEALPVGPCRQLSGPDGVELGDEAGDHGDGADFIEEQEHGRPYGMPDEIAHEMAGHGGEQMRRGLALMLFELEEQGDRPITRELSQERSLRFRGTP